MAMTKVIHDDLYEEMTKKQTPSNTMFLVKRHTPTHCTYRWKIDESTAAASPMCCCCPKQGHPCWECNFFGGSSRFFIEFDDIGHVNREGNASYSLFLWSEFCEGEEEGYVHFYAGFVNPVSHKVESYVLREGLWWGSVPKMVVGGFRLYQKKIGFNVFAECTGVERIMDRDGDIVLEIGIETAPYHRANPIPPLRVPRITSSCTKAILPIDIFHCAVCQDVCDFDAVLCASGEHVICIEHVTWNSVNLCGCCKTNLKNARPMPALLNRLYRTVSAEPVVNNNNSASAAATSSSSKSKSKTTTKDN